MVGIRRALALLILSLYFWQFLLTALLGPEELFAAFVGLSACYGVAFIGVAAEWFWARWFAMGVGNFGSLFLLTLLQVGFEPSIAILGFSHLAVTLLLAGEGMAARYERSEAAAERWNFQEESLTQLRRAVKSAGMSLPLLILYTLAPKPELLEIGALGLGVAGLAGLVRGRTWSLFALGGAGMIALLDGLGVFGAPAIGCMLITPNGSLALSGPIFALLASTLLVVPLLFARPIVRFLRQPG
ncbi:MAG: hypothetical protein H6710_01415 [Myxococcales bacterium]|nr:hypothetical protein [Myxococcales bacterium]MCB9702932.1 hypothetical protein [Myxococcales bacterium]